MKIQRPSTGRDTLVSAAPLHITRIPAIGLVELQAAIDDVIWWQQHQAITREDRIARDDALVRLLQARWHVHHAMPAMEQAA